MVNLKSAGDLTMLIFPYKSVEDHMLIDFFKESNLVVFGTINISSYYLPPPSNLASRMNEHMISNLIVSSAVLVIVLR